MASLAAPATGDEGTASAIGTLIAAWAANPYVGAVMTILQVIGFFSARASEADMSRRLADVQEELREVNEKVTEVLIIVRELPAFISRKIDDNTRKQIVTQINAKVVTIRGVLAKYPDTTLGELRKDISAPDAEQLRSTTIETMELVEQLQEWGPDASIAIAQGYAVFLRTCQATGFAPLDPEVVRGRILTQLERAHSLLAAARYGLQSIVEKETALLKKAAPRAVFSGAVYNHANNQLSNFYGAISGNLKDGFSKAGPQKVGGFQINDRNNPSLGTAWPDAGVQPSFDGDADGALKRHLKYLNERRAKLGHLQKQLVEIVPLERATLALLLTVAARETLPISLTRAASAA